MANIESIAGYKVWDASGASAVHVVVTTNTGTQGSARFSVLDRDQTLRRISAEVQPALLGKNTAEQASNDRRLLELNVASSEKFGEPFLHAISLAMARAEAALQGLPFYLYVKQLFPKRALRMPLPFITVLKEPSALVSHYIICPKGTTALPDALEMGKAIFEIIKKNKGFSSVSTEERLLIMTHAVEQAGYTPGVDVMFCLRINLKSEKNNLSKQEVQMAYQTWQKRYALIAMQDALFNPSDIGTLTELLKNILIAQDSKETVAIQAMDDISAVDIAVATGSDHIVLGIPRHAENIENYNRLLAIYNDMIY